VPTLQRTVAVLTFPVIAWFGAGCVDTPTEPGEAFQLSLSTEGTNTESLVLNTSLTLPVEEVEPPVDLNSILVYETLLPDLGEVLSDPLAVTDAELAGVGSSDVVVPLQLGTPILFVVDDDLAQCPDADFTTATGIQQAIALAPAGARIRVCAGVYTPIIVDKTLIIEHPVQHGQATRCQAALTPDPTKDAIIDAENLVVIAAVTLAANDIVLYGFHVQNTDGGTGIYSLPTFSGYQILFNVVQENTFGLYFNASGVTESVAEHNCFRFNNRPGSASGDGIYSDQGLSNAVMQNNFFTGHNMGAIVMALNQQDITIVHNDIVDDGAIVLIGTDNAFVGYNHQMALVGSGIFVGGGVTDTRIAYNLIDNPSVGINVSTQFLPAPPNQLVVEKNHVRGARVDGIRFDNTSNSSIIGNKSQRNVQDGIRLRNNSNMNLVQDNLSRDNGRDGIRVDGPASMVPSASSNMNTIERNTALGNFEHDCHDDTAGAGTGLTANTWIRNIGKTENRPGLCKKKP
jgi:parallel beta-helix repeat protein